MPNKSAAGVSVAYLNEDHPAASNGAGYYEVSGEDEGNPSFGGKMDMHPQDTSKGEAK